MKTLLTIFTLVFSMMFSSNSFAEWAKVTRSVNGDTFYVDYERIRKHDGFVSFWTLSDFLMPTKWGDFSTETYRQGDCRSFRLRNLRVIQYKQQMGRGSGDVYNPKNIKWHYPLSDSVNETILETVCGR